MLLGYIEVIEWSQQSGIPWAVMCSSCKRGRGSSATCCARPALVVSMLRRGSSVHWCICAFPASLVMCSFSEEGHRKSSNAATSALSSNVLIVLQPKGSIAGVMSHATNKILIHPHKQCALLDENNKRK